jgi:hypothetical protein
MGGLLQLRSTPWSPRRQHPYERLKQKTQDRCHRPPSVAQVSYGAQRRHGTHFGHNLIKFSDRRACWLIAVGHILGQYQNRVGVLPAPISHGS